MEDESWTRPVVFIGPYEHHSNELPWRESIADVVVIGEDSDGRIDLEELEAELIRHADRLLKIGSFCAASNVTGLGSNTRDIASILHRHQALSFWDFAAAGPYVEIEMNMKDEEEDGHLIYKDAIFLFLTSSSGSRHTWNPGRQEVPLHERSALDAGWRHRRLRQSRGACLFI